MRERKSIRTSDRWKEMYPYNFVVVFRLAYLCYTYDITVRILYRHTQQRPGFIPCQNVDVVVEPFILQAENEN